MRKKLLHLEGRAVLELVELVLASELVDSIPGDFSRPN